MTPLPSEPSRHAVGAWLRLIALGVVAGIAVSILTPVVSELGRRTLALGVLGIGLLIVALASGRAREIVLFAWVVSLTYNRQFWSFAPLVGDYGAFGPYWMISDLLLSILLLQWAYDAIVLKRPGIAQGAPVMLWYVPFAIVAALSVVGAREPGWALGDLARIAKLGLVVMYFRYNVGIRQWWVVVAGLGAAVSIQSVFGMLEVATGRTGVLGILGLGGPEASEVLGITELFGGWTRATGTVAHPPYLAAFLVLTVPVFMSLAFTGDKRLSRLCAGVALLGLVGLACTLGRSAIAIMMGQTLLLFVALIGLRMVPVTRMIALAAFAGLLISVAGLFTADLVYDRLTRDLTASVDQRFAEYVVAANMVRDHPLLGVGLNNYAAYMHEYGSSAAWGIERRWHEASMVTHMRLLAGPLNGFLYVATVTGLLGLAAFLWLAIGGMFLAWRGIGTTTGPMRAVCLGLVVGMVGVFLEQSLSYSIWIDTVLAVWIVSIALAGYAARRPQPQTAA
jgi:O-antigen ligase